jgi:hypothetical protein
MEGDSLNDGVSQSSDPVAHFGLGALHDCDRHRAPFRSDKSPADDRGPACAEPGTTGARSECEAVRAAAAGWNRRNCDGIGTEEVEPGWADPGPESGGTQGKAWCASDDRRTEHVIAITVNRRTRAAMSSARRRALSSVARRDRRLDRFCSSTVVI